jgi:hypothetical protein
VVAKSRGSGTANYHGRGAARGRLVGNQSPCAKNATIIYAHSAAEGEDVGAADFKVALMSRPLSNNWCVPRLQLPIIQHLPFNKIDGFSIRNFSTKAKCKLALGKANFLHLFCRIEQRQSTQSNKKDRARLYWFFFGAFGCLHWELYLYMLGHCRRYKNPEKVSRQTTASAKFDVKCFPSSPSP